MPENWSLFTYFRFVLFPQNISNVCNFKLKVLFNKVETIDLVKEKTETSEF